MSDQLSAALDRLAELAWSAAHDAETQVQVHEDRAVVAAAVEQARADERKRLNRLADSFKRRADEAGVRSLSDPHAYTRRVVWDRAAELVRAALADPEAGEDRG